MQALQRLQIPGFAAGFCCRAFAGWGLTRARVMDSRMLPRKTRGHRCNRPVAGCRGKAADRAPYSMVPAASSVEHEAELQRRIGETIALAVHAGDEDDIDIARSGRCRPVSHFRGRGHRPAAQARCCTAPLAWAPTLDEAHATKPCARYTIRAVPAWRVPCAWGRWPTAWSRRWSVSTRASWPKRLSRC